MATLTFREHTVRTGETLSAIAKQFNVSSWKLIYYAKVNDDLRRRRDDPNRIAVGDRVVIPPNIRDVLKERLQRLEDLRATTEKSFTEQKQILDAELKKAKNFGTAVDVAAAVFSAVGGIVSVAKAYHGSLKLAGTALAEANAKLLKASTAGKCLGTFTFQLGAPGLADLAGLVVTNTTGELTGNEGLVWAVTRIVIETAMDTVSPSFWARALASRSRNPPTLAAAHAEAVVALETARMSALRPLGEKISKTRQWLSDYEAQILTLTRTA
jgi:hypothetical protein